MLTTSRCQCGAEFCYVCGESWQGMHGCPQYGPAVYDEAGYNQDGFHRDTGLDREGQTRLRALTDADADDSDEDEDPDAFHFVLQHVDAAMRATFNALPRQDREAFLLNLQIQLFEERGITFDLPDEHGLDNDGRDHDEEDDEDEDDDTENLDEDDYLGDIHDRTKDDDNDPDSDRDNDADTNDEDPNTTGQIDSVQDIGQNNAPLAADIGTPGNVNEALTRPDGALVGIMGMEESFDAITEGLGAFIKGASSSVTSPDMDRPANPMEVESAEQGTKQEHELSPGMPGSLPDDEDS